MKSRRHALVASLVVATTLSSGGFALAQTESWPSRPIRMLVGFSAGGGADAIARTVAKRLTEQLGQNVVVENRPGASSTIAAELLATSAPDGYSIMLADSSLQIASRAMARVNFDILKSFDAVGGVALAPLVLAVAANSPLQSLEQMAEAARKSDAPLIYATSGIGTVHHLAMEYLLSQAKIKMTHVPYRGASQLLPDVISGQVPIGVLSAGAAIGAIQSGRLRALGMTSPVKLPGAEWRAVADWLPGFDASPRLFLIAPAGTPEPILVRLDKETRAALTDGVVRETLLKQGAVPMPATRAELIKTLPVELDRWSTLIRSANIEIK